jgi:hypothetical protein
MTANQVAALRAQEDRRHNAVTEQEAATKRHNENVLKQAEIELEANDVVTRRVSGITGSVKNLADSFKAIMSPFGQFK